MNKCREIRVRVQIAFAALTILCSCAHRSEPRLTAGPGDVGQYILRQAVARGGQPIITNGLPALKGSWRYFEDQYGVMIRMSRQDYEAVEGLLRQAFGPPKFGPTVTTDGGKLGGYRLTPNGGAIQFGYDHEGTHVTILRILTEQEFSDGLHRATRSR